MTGIRFRVIQDNRKLFDTPPMEIPFPQVLDRFNELEDFTKAYDALKLKYPDAEIIVICETILWETYKPLTNLLPDDIPALLKKMDTEMRKGIL